MGKSARGQSEVVASDDRILFATMDDDEALEEVHLIQSLDHKPLEELFDTVINTVREMVLSAANKLKENPRGSTESKTGIKQYLEMSRLLRSLQHWADDIQVRNKSPLAITAKDNDRFNSLALILRTQFLDITLACSVVDKATETTRQESIDHLDQLLRQLRTFVTPLRTFLEEALGIGNAQIVRNAGCGLDSDRFGEPKESITLKDNTTLLDKISRSTINSKFDTGTVRKFAPNGLIRGLVLPGAVRATLAKGLPSGEEEVDQELVDYIVFQSRNLFAICLNHYLGKSSLLKAMVLFKKNSMSDADLPLEWIKAPAPVNKVDDDNYDENDRNKSSQNSLSVEDTTFSTTLTQKYDSKLHEIDPEEEIWGFPRRQSFIETEQWVFLAPVFSTVGNTVDLMNSSVLPFSVRDNGINGEGCGNVSRIEIQKGHLKDPDNLFGSRLPSSYALKEIGPNWYRYRIARNWRKKLANFRSDSNWTKELAILRSVTRLRHRNILRFVAAFRKGDSEVPYHYLIYEWADGGSLRDFWNSHIRPESTSVLVEEVVAQLVALADALFTIHYSSKLGAGILHGGLKPENILRFKAGVPGLLGTLKIGDWGFPNEKSLNTVLENDQSTYRASRKYEPPEMREGVHVVGRNTTLKTRSRLCDIWSFGCIMLEFIVWLAEGTHGLTKLDTSVGDTENNQFWEQRRGDRLDINAQLQVRDSIRHKMDELDSPATGMMPELRELLHFVRNRALVIHLPTYLAALEPRDVEGLEVGDLARLDYALEGKDLKGLEPRVLARLKFNLEVGGRTGLKLGDLALLDSASTELTSSTPYPRDETTDDEVQLSRPTTTEWIRSFESYHSRSTNRHTEVVEITKTKEPPKDNKQFDDLDTQSTTEDMFLVGSISQESRADVTPNRLLEALRPKEPPRAKTTELLKTMRQIMRLSKQ